MSETAAYLFDPEAIRRAEEPAEDTARLFWMFVTLVRERAVTYERYMALFNRTTRTFKRDIAKLRDLGERYGFSLSALRSGEVRLAMFEDGRRRAPRQGKQSDCAAEALLAVVDALGEVVSTSLRGWADLPETPVDRFLRIATPRLRDGSAVAATYAQIREAWQRRARVRFGYPARGNGAITERIVEPYLVTYNAGRYYLVGFDIRPRTGGWRQYAIDRIAGEPVPSGSFSPRLIPHAYRGEDAIGLFKTGNESEITVAFSATIEQAVLARQWQRSERIGRDSAGRVTLTFLVHDIGETVRWALGFGSEAEILAPPEAVNHAGRMVSELRKRYRTEKIVRSA